MTNNRTVSRPSPPQRDARKNVLIVGGTGTGKTTLLAALAAKIPDSDRIVLIDAAAEVHLNQPNVVRLQARQAQAPI